MKKFLFLLPLTLTACAATPKPEVRIQTVYCVTPEQYQKLVDAEPKKIGNSATGDLKADYKISTEQNILVRRYADGLLNVIGHCMGNQLK